MSPIVAWYESVQGFTVTVKSILPARRCVVDPACYAKNA